MAIAPIIEDAEFLRLCEIGRVDSLNCNIERTGSCMMHAATRLLNLKEHAAIELHNLGGDPQRCLDTLEAERHVAAPVDWSAREIIASIARSPAPRLAA